MESDIFSLICRQVAAETPRIQSTARALACLDAVAGLAETAARRRYIKPTMHDGDEIEIVHGRHPVIEAFNEDPFVPNSVYLNNSTDRLLIITGPNMGGKSTGLRLSTDCRSPGQLPSIFTTQPNTRQRRCSRRIITN